MVDQRFISRLIQTRTFEYTLDLTQHNRRDVQNRIVEIPYSIIEAFAQRQITLTIIAGSTTYSFAPGFANSNEVQTVGLGIGSSIRLEIFQTGLTMPGLPQGQVFAATPQRLEMNIISPQRRTMINNLGAPVEIAHRVSLADAMDRNIGAYRAGGNYTQWTAINHRANEQTGALTFSTTRTGHFAPIGVNPPLMLGASSADINALFFVNSVIRIDELVVFGPNDNVNVWQVNRLILAAARRDSHANINADLTPAETSSLTNAGMLVPGAMTVSRDAAIAALVRLYEVRSGFPITGQPTATNSHFIDINQSNPAFLDAMLRAEHIGLLSFDTNFANPQGNLTFSELMRMMEIILRHS